MRWYSGLWLSVLVLATALGCNTLARQPSLRDAEITPRQIAPGQEAVITVQVSDKFGIVKRVDGTVEEYPEMVLPFKDDGRAPDAAAGDGIWTAKADVKFMAPQGKFVLRIGAYNSKGQPIEVKVRGGGREVLSTTCQLEIVYPPE